MSKPTPITIRGTTYPSKAAAARAIGCTKENIRIMNKKGRADRIGLTMGHNRIPVTINGVAYNSKLAAREELGISHRDLARLLAAEKSR